MPFDLRVLTTPTYLGHGHFGALQHLDAFREYKEAILQRCVPEVCEKIVNFIATDYIVFPSNNDETLSIKCSFNARFGMPHVVGIMDGFPVRLSKVAATQEQAFKRRHSNLAINVQVVCDNKYRFLNVNPRAPGGTSGIFVWKHSHIYGIMKNLFVTAPTWLIADHGYNLEDILISPQRNPRSLSDFLFNALLEAMLSVLDTAIIMLTSCFRWVAHNF